MEERPRRRRRPRKRGLGIKVLPLLTALIVVGTIIFALWHGYDLLHKIGVLHELQQKNEILLKENEDMEHEAKQLQDPKYIEGVAREELGLVKPGEAPYIH